jgi:hypothetical protein
MEDTEKKYQKDLESHMEMWQGQPRNDWEQEEMETEWRQLQRRKKLLRNGSNNTSTTREQTLLQDTHRSGSTVTIADED